MSFLCVMGLHLTVGWTPFRPGSGDAEPRRCRRTDGKKWRCSRDAIGDQRYCERHIKRNCPGSRKHVESRKVTPTIAEPSMAVSGGPALHSYAVPWQQQAKSSAANVTDPFSRESNRWNYLILHDLLACLISVSYRICKQVFVKINDICWYVLQISIQDSGINKIFDLSTLPLLIRSGWP